MNCVKVREAREIRKGGQQIIIIMIIGHLMQENQKKGMVSACLSYF